MAAGRSILITAALSAGFLTAACEDAGSKPDLIDAAALYAANEGLFLSIRAAYPGPYRDFKRIPARNPAEATKSESTFLSYLRKDLPVEFIDFFPIGDTGEDEIDIVLWRYETNGAWNTVSLVYFSEPMTFAEESQTVRSFDACDSDARNWLQSQNGGGAAAFCQINERWRAYQRVD